MDGRWCVAEKGPLDLWDIVNTKYKGNEVKNKDIMYKAMGRAAKEPK